MCTTREVKASPQIRTSGGYGSSRFLFFLHRRLDELDVKCAGLFYKEDTLRILDTTAFMFASTRDKDIGARAIFLAIIRVRSLDYYNLRIVGVVVQWCLEACREFRQPAIRSLRLIAPQRY